MVWVAIGRAFTSAKNPNRHSLIALIAVSILAAVFVLANILGANPPPIWLGFQLASTAFWYVIIGRPKAPEQEDEEAEEAEEVVSERRRARCPGCGAGLDDGTKFCEGCGKRVVKERVCLRCGETSGPSAKFCKGCGNTFSPKKKRPKSPVE